MKAYSFIDQYGSFHMEHPEKNSYLYFPLAGESGLKSCVSPLLGGDCKIDQNTFLLQPVSAEEMHNLRSGRNFWCLIDDVGAWSATGLSAETESLQGTDQEEDCVLEAGLMWHQIRRRSRKYPLSSELISYVPCDERTFEIMKVTIRNHGEKSVTVTPAAAIPIYGRSADNIRDHRHVTSLLHRVKVTEWGVEVTPTLTFDERGHKKNTQTYFVYGAQEDKKGPRACCPRVIDFIGEGGSLTHPGQIYGAENASQPDPGIWKSAGSEDAGWEAMGALLFDQKTLAPGEEAVYCIYMGITQAAGADQARCALMADYAGTEAVDRALERVKQEWIKKVNVHYETGNKEQDAYLYWVTFQPILRRLYGCSFLPYHDYGKGGRGWRDLWQDCLALLIMEPEKVRNMLADNYGGVRLDGTNATIIGQRQGEFLADRNHIARVWMDHGLWPFLATEFYIRQTGDLDLFSEEAPYFKDSLIYRGERRDESWTPEDGTNQRIAADGEILEKNAANESAGHDSIASGTILEHILIQNITAFYDVGDHNHIRLRGADWNDGFDMAAERGESVAFTAAYAGSLEQIAEMMERYAAINGGRMAFHEEVCVLFEDRREIYDSVEEKQRFLTTYCASCARRISGKKREVVLTEAAKTLRGMAEWMKEHIRQTEWVRTPEGSFYNGYYDNHGRQLEGTFSTGTRMTLTGQVFPIMYGVATDGQIREITRAADVLLYRPEIGGYRLNTDFREMKDDMGRAFGFAYGHKENGAVFSHMTVMYANALYKRGFIKEGYLALDTLYRHAANFEVSRTYPGLPEYFADTGRGMYPYLTGSASWLMMTVVTEVYGVKGCFGDLVFEPKLLDEQLDENGATGIRLHFAGAELHIRYEAAEKKEIYTAVKALYLDEVPVEGNKILREKLLAGGSGPHEIRAVI